MALDTSMWARLAQSGQFDPMESYGRFAQLQAIAQGRKLREMQIREAEAELGESQRKRTEQGAMRDAFAGAYVPGVQGSHTELPGGRAITIPGAQPTFNRSRIYDKLAAVGQGQAIPGLQSKFATQDFDRQKQMLELQGKILEIAKTGGEVAKGKLERIKTTMGIVGQMASELDALEKKGAPMPELQYRYTNLLERAKAHGIDVSHLPPRYTPGAAGRAMQEAMEVDKAIDNARAQSEADERGRHNKETERLTARGQNLQASQPPSEVREYEYAQKQGFKGSFQDWKKEGRVSPKATGAQSTALRYLIRGEQASADIQQVEDKIAKKSLGGQAWLNVAPNFMQSDEGKLYNQAAKSFTEARLRKDSGAAIPVHEFENDRKMYFAQPGDTAEVLAQKRTSRARVLEGIAAESGPAFDDYYGEGFRPGMFVEKYGGGQSGGPAQSQSGPAVGTVEGGYRFKGGNPADPKNWEKVN